MKKIFQTFFIVIGLLIFWSSAKAAPLDVTSLSFAWSDPVSMAVFERDDSVWIVFNRRKVIDVKDIEKQLRKLDASVLSIPHSKGTVLRLKLGDDAKPFVRKEGLLWIVDFIVGSNDGKTSLKELQTQIKRDGLDKPYVFIENKSFAEPISIVDPEVGDVIVVTPALDSSVGVAKDFNFVDFDLLKSMQGFAIVPKNDEVIVIRSNDGASIKMLKSGLSVSDNLDDLQRLLLLEEQSSKAKAFDVDVPESLLSGDFVSVEKELKKDIEMTTGETRIKARFQLAKYYVVKALGFEALEVLSTMLEENELSGVQKQQVYGLMGVANFLVRRYEKALSNLSYGELKDNFVATFWRKIAEAAMNPFLYRQSFIDYASIIKDYPVDLQVKIAEIAAQASLNASDDLGAQNFIDVIKLSANDNVVLTYKLLFLTAQNLYLQGFPRDSLETFEELVDSNSQEYSSYARFAVANLRYEIKAQDIDKTINELEKIKFAWAKKSFKIRILKSLADLYSKKHDYNKAVAIMLEEYDLVGENEKNVIKMQIIKLLEDLYIENQADDTPALKALSLYNEHIELIKKSDKYLEIVIAVADRFFAVDLVDNAKDLLEDALEDKDITEAQRYKAGARLALIYLHEKLYNLALETLDKTQILTPDVNLENQRDVIKASVYKELGMYDEALGVLGENYSTLATLLKSEIYWLNEDYENLSLELKFLIEEPVAGKELSDEQIKYILDWMMALKKAKKDIVLARARAKFLPWFENTKYYSTFDILTSQFEYDKVDMNDIANRIRNIEIFSNFNKKIAENLKNIVKSENIK